VTIDFSDIPWPIVLLGLEFPAVLALVDCSFRPHHHFAGGPEDKRAWQRWLIVSVVTVPILVGFLLLVGYYHVVIRRNSPFSRGR
jgi:hypothetical protein